MKPSLAGGAIAIVLLILLVVAYSTFFTVYQTRQALAEDDMMAEALRRAREHLQGKRDMLPEHVRSTQEKERYPLFLVQAWLRGRATALKEVASKTGYDELRAQLNRIIRLPIIVSPDEAFYFFK